MVADSYDQVPLASVCEGIFDGPHATPKKTSRGPVFLGIWNLSQGRLDLSQTEHLSVEDFAKWTRRVIPQHGDLVFSYETRLGQAAMIPEGLDCCLGRRMGLIRPDRRRVNPRFLLYAFLGPEFQQTVRERTIAGSTVERILLTELGKYPIRIPPLPEQTSVASLLGALDDKIDLNNRMVRTLEAMARALFRSWFMDFDPIVAKAAGQKPTTMGDDIAGLFPVRFVEAPIGPVPEGWVPGKLGDVIELNRRSIAEGSPDRRITYVDISSVSTGRLESTVSYDLDGAPSRARRLVQDGDTIWSCVRPNRRSYLFIDEPPDDLVVSTGFAVLSPKGVPASFLYQLVTTESFAEYLSANAEGSAYPAVRPEAFARAEIILPPEAILSAFEKVARPWRKEIAQLNRESHTLFDLKDALLPPLLAGEIRVEQAEHLVEHAI
jgi:type I restriction enzyme, S subunit